MELDLGRHHQEVQVTKWTLMGLYSRHLQPSFDWRKLEGAEVILFKGGQPLDMFKYACHQTRACRSTRRKQRAPEAER